MTADEETPRGRDEGTTTPGEQPAERPVETNPPTVEQPTIEQPTIEQPTVEQPTVGQPTVGQPAGAEPSDTQPSEDDPTDDEPGDDDTSDDEPSNEEASNEETCGDDTSERDDTGDEGTTPDEEIESGTDPRTAWNRLLRMGRPRATRANVIGLLLALGLGFAFATQVQQTHEQGLENLREDELVRVLDDVTQDSSRLASELRDLEATRDKLTTGAGASEEAQKAAQERLDTLAVLAGTVPVEGPGIVVTIHNPTGEVRAADVLDAVEELRDAGAEAMQIDGVRVVASTYFSDTDAGIEVEGTVLKSPIRIVAIGDPPTMASAMDIPGGVTERVRQRGGSATVSQEETLEVTALHTVPEPRYAQPVPEASATPSS
jgi:uncharacterized protein YlxW (UPF0749 family)